MIVAERIYNLQEDGETELPPVIITDQFPKWYETQNGKKGAAIGAATGLILGVILTKILWK